MKGILGYILCGVGVVGLALTYEPVQKIVAVPLPAEITPLYLTIGSLAILVVGLLLLTKSGGRPRHKSVEVPIYHGKEIIGYRRTGK